MSELDGIVVCVLGDLEDNGWYVDGGSNAHMKAALKNHGVYRDRKLYVLISEGWNFYKSYSADEWTAENNHVVPYPSIDANTLNGAIKKAWKKRKNMDPTFSDEAAK
jgi:hypothetical protein